MELSDEQRGQLRGLVGAVRGSVHGLMSSRGREELELRHVPECVALAGILPEDATVLDVGSGGGFPGLVIAIVRPELDVVLLEATGKKARFLAETAELLEVEVGVVNQRAEDAARGELAEAFDAVTARAVAPLDRLVGWTVPFLAPDGQVYAIKGARLEQELEEAGPALRRERAQVVGTPELAYEPVELEASTGGGSCAGSSTRVVILARS